MGSSFGPVLTEFNVFGTHAMHYSIETRNNDIWDLRAFETLSLKIKWWERRLEMLKTKPVLMRKGWEAHAENLCADLMWNIHQNMVIKIRTFFKIVCTDGLSQKTFSKNTKAHQPNKVRPSTQRQKSSLFVAPLLKLKVFHMSVL